MVTLDEMAVIRRRWREQGKPPCDHTNIEREYSPGERTGDWGCMTCGVAWPTQYGEQPPPGWIDKHYGD